ncbi:MAG: glycosyltransferase [Saprospiraceae bacterium]|nr:glycosyltransferase [Candidatus Vicinibacter affinis]
MSFALIIYLFYAFLFIQLLFWILQLSKITYYIPPTPSGTNSFPPVTVLICIKNEYDNLKSNLPSIIDQKYEKFEVLIVDDHSSDRGVEYLKSRYINEPRLTILELNTGVYGKKNAILEATKFAKHNILLLTDADCTPQSEFWISEMVNGLGNEQDIVLGYTPYLKEPSLLNRLIRFETCLNGAQILSAAHLGFPYAGVGRNILYRRSLVSAEALKMSYLSGDDDLLVNGMATKKNTSICLNPNSFVFSTPKKSWKEYFMQRWRHYSTSTGYSIGSQVYLFINFMSLIGFYGVFIMLLFLQMPLYAWIAYTIRLIIIWPIFFTLSRKFKETGLSLLFPILELVYVLFICLQLPLLFVRKKTW